MLLLFFNSCFVFVFVFFLTNMPLEGLDYFLIGRFRVMCKRNKWKMFKGCCFGIGGIISVWKCLRIPWLTCIPKLNHRGASLCIVNMDKPLIPSSFFIELFVKLVKCCETMRGSLMACEFLIVQLIFAFGHKICFSIIPHFIFLTYGLFTFSVKGHVFRK